jgi:hypothetical protein
MHTTPLNTTFIEALIVIHGKEFICYPSPIKSPPNTHISKKYCMLHEDKGYDIEDYYVLNNKMERLIAKGYIRQFLKKDSYFKQSREEHDRSTLELPEINVILGGTFIGDDSNIVKKKVWETSPYKLLSLKPLARAHHLHPRR